MAGPLLEAIKMGRQEVAHRLLAGGEYYDLDYQQESQDGTPLFWAAAKGFEDLVRFLILLGASISTTTRWGGTPLHAAADGGHDGVVSILLENLADVNAVTSIGDTPCHLAAYRGNIKTTKRLVEAGADIHVKNKSGNDVMGEAEQNRHYEVMRFLWSIIKGEYKNSRRERGHATEYPEKLSSTSGEVRWVGGEARKSETGRLPQNNFTDMSPRRRYSAYLNECQKISLTYPPNITRRRSVAPLDRKQSNLVRHPLHEVQHRVSYNRSVECHNTPQTRPQYVATALTWHSQCSTPSEDEVDWETSLCVDSMQESFMVDKEL